MTVQCFFVADEQFTLCVLSLKYLVGSSVIFPPASDSSTNIHDFDRTKKKNDFDSSEEDSFGM